MKNTKRNTAQRLKQMLIYSVCAILPVLSIIYYFYQETYNRMEMELLLASQQSLTRISEVIDKDINYILNLTNRIYSHKSLYTLLENEYDFPKQYFQDYTEVIAPLIQMLTPIDSKIKYVSIYTNNPTIYNAGYVQRLDMPLSNIDIEPDRLETTGDGYYTYIYGKHYYHQQNGMLFSYIRNMNLYKSTMKFNSVIKIDLEPDSFRRTIEAEAFNGLVDIIDNNNLIVCSTQHDREWKQYQADNKDEKYKQVCYISTLPGWQIIGVTDVEYIKSGLNTQRNFAMLLLMLGGIYMAAVIYRLVNAVSVGQLRETQIMLQKKQAEFNALRNQVDPHFLFNILETVRMKLLLSGQKEHSTIIMRMAKLYRKLVQWEDDIVTLAEEVEFIREFMLIQEYRYDEALTWTMKVDDNALNFKVPKMLLHTFIENACKHGMNENGSESRIDISIDITDSRLFCRIKDNGSGFPAEEKELFRAMLEGRYQNPKGIGISNAIQRLRLYYGDRFELALDTREGSGTAIEIILPPMEG